MKKYSVSKYYVCLNSGLLILFLSGTVIQILWFDPIDPIPFTVGIIGILLVIYIMLTDLPTAKFSFSKEGITMYVGFKKYKTPWSEFVCAGIVAINVEAVRSIYTSDLFWVYFSKSPLTDKEKRLFLFKTRRDLNRVAYFQFSKPVFDLVLEQLPENLREDLKFDEELVIGKMNFWEKVYNK